MMADDLLRVNHQVGPVMLADDLLGSDYEVPNILFFVGISPQKYDMDTIFTSRLLESIEPDVTPEPEQASTFDRMPEYFETLETWPTSTNLRCGACSRTYKTRPAAVVTQIYNMGTQSATRMRVRVLTCSFDCAVWFIDTRYASDRRRWKELHGMLRVLYTKMTGLIAIELNKAPDPLEQDLYGGPLSLTTFIKRLRHVLPEMAPRVAA